MTANTLYKTGLKDLHTGVVNQLTISLCEIQSSGGLHFGLRSMHKHSLCKLGQIMDKYILNTNVHSVPCSWTQPGNLTGMSS